MPLPVAHVLLGAAIAERLVPRDLPRRGRLVGIAAGLTLLPDLDFVFVWVVGLERSWHRGFTHSVVFAIGVAALLLLPRVTSARVCLAWTVALLSHGLLDWSTTLRGQGIELWWPWSLERAKWSLFPLFEFSLPNALVPFEAALSVLYDAAVEAFFFLPLFLLSRSSLLRYDRANRRARAADSIPQVPGWGR